MKLSRTLVAILFASTSFVLWAQQSSPANPSNSPTAQQNPSATDSAPRSSPAASPETPTVEMSPVNGALVSKLDSKTAKTGDSVSVLTMTSIKTADGTEIPKGSTLVGHVIGVQPSAAGANSQVALQFDHIELKGGQSLTVHSQIESIAPAGGAASSGFAAAPGVPPAGGSNPNMNGANGARSAGGAPQGTSGAPGPAASAGNGGPPAGTVVAKTGNIAIETTSIPGVLLANNAPGQQDPRMAGSSGILLGAKQDIELEGGTQMVVGVSASRGRTQ